MRLHNKFEITADANKAIVVENTVTNAGKYLAKNLAYAAYIVLEGKQDKIVRRTRLIKLACGSGKIATACYKIELTENEYEGFVIQKIGFSPYADGHETANIAEVDYTKQLGSALVIVGTLYLELDFKAIELAGGENPLVSFFLGADVLPDNIVYTLVPYSGRLLQDFPSGTVVMTTEKLENGLKLYCPSFSGGSAGAYIYMNQTPIIHLPLLVRRYSQVATPPGNVCGTVWAGGKHSTFLDVYVDYKTAKDGCFLRSVTDVGELISSEIVLDKKGYFLTEPTGKYFAAVCEKSVIVFDNQTLKAIRIVQNHSTKVLPLSAEPDPEKRQIMLLSDGAVAFFDESLVIEKIDGTRIDYPVACGGQAAIVTAEDGYYLCCVSDGYIGKYRINENKSSLVGLQKANGHVCIFRCFDSIAVINGNAIEISNIREKDAAAEGVLFRFVKQHSAPYSGLEGVIRSSDGNVCNLFYESSFEVTESSFLINGGVMKLSEEGTSFVAFEESGGKKPLVFFSQKVLFGEFCGDRLIVKTEDGTLKTAKLFLGDFYYHNAKLAGKDAVFLLDDYVVATTINDLAVELSFCE